MSTPTQSAPDQVAAALSRTNQIFSNEVFGKRNFEALTDVYTSSARILPPGSPMISGLEGIKQFWSNLIESANASAVVLETIDVMLAGNDIVEIGRATLSIHPQGQSSAEIEVKYVVYWRQEGSRWKWHVDIWNQNS